MVSGHALPPEVHKIVIRLSTLLTCEQIAIYTGISISTVHNILNYFNKFKAIKTKGDEEKKRKKRVGELRDVDVQVCYRPDCFFWCLQQYQYLIDRVTRHPDIYLDELQELLARECGATASLSAIWQKLKVAGFMKKKVCRDSVSVWLLFTIILQQLSRIAAERSKDLRLCYRAKIGSYDPEQLVFVDESSVDRRTTYRRRAWSLRGTHAKQKAYFVRGKR